MHVYIASSISFRINKICKFFSQMLILRFILPCLRRQSNFVMSLNSTTCTEVLLQNLVLQRVWLMYVQQIDRDPSVL